MENLFFRNAEDCSKEEETYTISTTSNAKTSEKANEG